MSDSDKGDPRRSEIEKHLKNIREFEDDERKRQNFSSLYEIIYPFILLIIRSKINKSKKMIKINDEEDVLSEINVALLKKLKTQKFFNDYNHLIGFLMRVVTHKIISINRKYRKSNNENIDNREDPGPSPSASLENLEEVENLAADIDPEEKEFWDALIAEAREDKSRAQSACEHGVKKRKFQKQTLKLQKRLYKKFK